MTKRKSQGWVFLKVDLPADLYQRLQKACEAMTGKPRQVSSVMRLMAEFIVEDVEQRGGDEPSEDMP